jgi:hypothetical protein
MPGTFVVSQANVGQVIDTNAFLTAVAYTGKPTKFDTHAQFDITTGLPTLKYFCLIDNAIQPRPKQLLNFDPHINGGFSPHPTYNLMGGIHHKFVSLVLQSCPSGAVFAITTSASLMRGVARTDSPVVEAPPRPRVSVYGSGGYMPQTAPAKDAHHEPAADTARTSKRPSTPPSRR